MAPTPDQNAAVEVPTNSNSEQSENNGEQHTYVYVEEVINEADADDEKPPAYEEFVIDPQDQVAPPKYEDISEVVWDFVGTLSKGMLKDIINKWSKFINKLILLTKNLIFLSTFIREFEGNFRDQDRYRGRITSVEGGKFW